MILTATKKTPKPIGDVTRTARSAAYRDRLVAANGRRVVVDMPASVCEALDGLLASGYAINQKAVVCQALLDVAKRLKEKT